MDLFQKHLLKYSSARFGSIFFFLNSLSLSLLLPFSTPWVSSLYLSHICLIHPCRQAHTDTLSPDSWEPGSSDLSSCVSSSITPLTIQTGLSLSGFSPHSHPPRNPSILERRRKHRAEVEVVTDRAAEMFSNYVLRSEPEDDGAGLAVLYPQLPWGSEAQRCCYLDWKSPGCGPGVAYDGMRVFRAVISLVRERISEESFQQQEGPPLGC